MSAARDYFLLIYLSKCLGSIGSSLEDSDNIGIDWSEIEPSAPLAEATRSAETAIERVKEFSDEQWRCELLASALSNADLKRRTLTHLAEIHEAICQADKPAEMALIDGYEDEAIAICRDAFARAYDQCGRELKRLAAECETQARILYPRGFANDEMPVLVRELGFDPIEKNLATIPTLVVSELLEWLPAVDSHAKQPALDLTKYQEQFDAIGQTLSELHARFNTIDELLGLGPQHFCSGRPICNVGYFTRDLWNIVPWELGSREVWRLVWPCVSSHSSACRRFATLS